MNVYNFSCAKFVKESCDTINYNVTFLPFPYPLALFVSSTGILAFSVDWKDVIVS